MGVFQMREDRFPMTIGQLRHRITLQQPVKEPDGRGGWRDAWVDVAPMWAAVCPLRPFERLQGKQGQSGVSHKVVVRYRTDVASHMRFVWAGKYLYIQGPPIDPDGHRRWLQSLCEERKE